VSTTNFKQLESAPGMDGTPGPSSPPPPPQPPPPPPPSGPPPEWNPGDANKPSPAPLPSGAAPTPPPVPGGAGNGKHTSVDTPSLDLFAQNIGQLIQPVSDALSGLHGVNVQPGAFYHADVIRSKIGGANGDAGLKNNYTLVLNDLKNGLSDLQTAVTQMSAKYKSTEDLNGMKVSDLQNDFDSASSYFNSMTSDNGGSGSASAPPPPPGG